MSRLIWVFKKMMQHIIQQQKINFPRLFLFIISSLSVPESAVLLKLLFYNLLFETWCGRKAKTLLLAIPASCHLTLISRLSQRC
jgi:hypothetical protein